MRTLFEARMIVTKSSTSNRSQVDFDQLVFGRSFTDHMVSCEFDGAHWGEMHVQPLRSFEYHPASHVFHYGQAIFEGLKAYKTDEGGINLFRAADNISRLNKSAIRLAMPTLDEEQVMEAMLQWMELDRSWVPEQHQGSLYVRPFMIATSHTLRAIPSETFRYMLIGSPVGFYYSEPISVKLESNYSRAVKGGVGFAKAAGNYAAAFMPSAQAKKEGFDQLLWTDRSEEQYLEELGSANVFFMVDDCVYTPNLHDSILAGITRDSVIRLFRASGIEVKEEPIPKAFLREQLGLGKVKSLFATGTAAAITFIRNVEIDGERFQLYSEKEPRVLSVKQQLENIKFARGEDPHGWNLLM